jgi:predicted HAD superfamily Cof-like phosphohydrolase
MVRSKIIQAFIDKGLMAEGATKFIVTQNGGDSVCIIDTMVEFMKNNALLQVVSDVRDFCDANDQTVRHLLEDWSEAERSFRMGLIKEETKELVDASLELNSVEERDAIIDSIYVLCGYSLQRGIAGSLSKDWKLVHNNNMTKICDSEETARDTVAKQKRQLVDCEYFPTKNGFFVVKRKEDGKVLKSHKYTPVKLGQNTPLDHA